MPKIKTGDIETYYEIYGEGKPLVFVHGGWANYEMWKPQIEYFSDKYTVIVYDVRGHGLTGSSSVKRYSIRLFAEDLKALLDALNVKKPVICGLSMGGMIAQTYAVMFNDDIDALILCDTAISTSLTFFDKIVRYILAPKWMFLLFVRLMGINKYSDFAFWFAEKSRGAEWVKNKEFIKYEKEQMKKFTVKEFNKIFAALYDFKLQKLSNIKVPVLFMNGEFESKSVFKHTEIAKTMIKDTQSVIIPNAGHASNYENASVFNKTIEDLIIQKLVNLK